MIFGADPIWDGWPFDFDDGPKPPDLTPFYGTGPGKIAIHFDTDHATKNAGGKVTALQNRGGAGGYFDAVVSGSPIPVSGKMLAMENGVSGYPTSANFADLLGVRMLLVVAAPSYPSGSMPILGGRYAEANYTVVVNSNPSTGQLVRVYSSSGGGIDIGSRSHWGIAPNLIEVEFTATHVSAWRNGAALGAQPHSWTAFPVANLGKGENIAASGLTGSLGDVLGVTLGAGDTEAITAARAYLAARHGVVLA